jgi:hypothetical protein
MTTLYILRAGKFFLPSLYKLHRSELNFLDNFSIKVGQIFTKLKLCQISIRAQIAYKFSSNSKVTAPKDYTEFRKILSGIQWTFAEFIVAKPYSSS